MIRSVILLALATSSFVNAAEPWEPLFDGKNLKAWQVHSGKAKYEVQDGVVIGTTMP